MRCFDGPKQQRRDPHTSRPQGLENFSGEVCIRTNWLKRKVCDVRFGEISWWCIA